MRRMATLVVLEVWFFQGVRFLGVRFSQVQGPGPGPAFRAMPIVLFVLCHKADQISESKPLNRSKADSHFFRGD